MTCSVRETAGRGSVQKREAGEASMWKTRIQGSDALVNEHVGHLSLSWRQTLDLSGDEGKRSIEMEDTERQRVGRRHLCSIDYQDREICGHSEDQCVRVRDANWQWGTYKDI